MALRWPGGNPTRRPDHLEMRAGDKELRSLYLLRHPLSSSACGTGVGVQARIIGCGNLDRGDDAAGVLVARRLRALGIEAEEQSGESFSLMECWQGFEMVVVVDAICSDHAPGELRIWDACSHPLPKAALQCSTHAFGLYEAVELARTLDRLPDKLLI